MANVLFVKANPKVDEQSISTTLANHFFKQYKEKHPEDTVEKLDLYQTDIPFLDVDVFSAWGKFASREKLNEAESEKVKRMDELTNQFLRADKVVIAAPFWNLSYPPMLKAYIDTICIAGKTFEYTEKGPVGLVPDKPFLLIETRGGFYSEGPAAEMENSKRYLTTIMRFMGIETHYAVVAEGLDVNDETREEAVKVAQNKLQEVSNIF